MARPLRIEFKGALYHILSRGNDRRDIFFKDDDYKESDVGQILDTLVTELTDSLVEHPEDYH